MPKPQAPPEGIMVDSVREYVQIITAAREIIQQWRRYQRTGILAADRDKLAEDAQFLIQTTRYALRLWIAEGAWTAYYAVRSGSVHNCIACRTIDPVYTSFQPILELTGLTIQQVVAKGYRVCAHCRKRPQEKTIQRVERLADKMCFELQVIIEALRQQ